MATHISTPRALASGRSTANAASTDAPARGPSLRPVRMFALVALPLGWAIMSIPLLLGLPVEPFVLPTVLFALLLPALLITRREAGTAGVRALLRDAIRLPRPRWWVFAAVAVIPAVTWLTAAALGDAEPLTRTLLVGFLIDLLVAAALVNVWEETAWTGFAQRRLVARWGVVRGSVTTAALFAGVHLPLAFQGRITVTNVLLGVAVLFVLAIGLRLIIGYLDGWSSGSLLTIGLLHASFNGTADLIDPAHDWVRLAVTLAIGLALVTITGRRNRGSGVR
jgi:membrane protease YdiL (CAAX protease family)